MILTPAGKTDIAGLRATHGGRFCGAPRPAPRHEGKGIYAGFHPAPRLRELFWEKAPKDPKKPNCMGFRLSNKDSEQVCRRQPCFFVRRTQHRMTASAPRSPTAPPYNRRAAGTPASCTLHAAAHRRHHCAARALHAAHRPNPPAPRRSIETANFLFICKAFQTLSSAYQT